MSGPDSSGASTRDEVAETEVEVDVTRKTATTSGAHFTHLTSLFILILMAMLAVVVASLTLSDMIFKTDGQVQQILARLEELEYRSGQSQQPWCDCGQGSGAEPTQPATSLYSPTLFFKDSDNALPPISLASDVQGNAHVAGSFYGSGAVSQSVAGTGFVSIGEILNILQSINDVGECTGVVCVHGVLARDCSCVCIGTEWTGQICDTHTCNMNGAWNNVTGQCDCQYGFDPFYNCKVIRCLNGAIDYSGACRCNDGFTGVYCEQPIGNCDPGCEGICVNGQCVCQPFTVGPLCQYNCTPAGVRAGECFFELLNTGYDVCESFGTTLVCYCGGGYEYATSDLYVKVARCDNCVPDSIDMAYCCSPGVRCDTGSACNTVECCRQYISDDACAAAGCFWCSTEQFCTAIDAGENLCEVTGTVNVPRIQWKTEIVPCSSAFQEECSEEVRQAYLGIYNQFLVSGKYTDPRRRARDYINSVEWDMQQTALDSDIGKTFFLEVASSALTTAICGTQYTAFIGPTLTFTTTDSDVLGIVCRRSQALTFSLGIRPPCDSVAGQGKALLYFANGGYKCVSTIITPRNQLQSLTESSTAVDRAVAVGRSLSTYSFGVENMAAICANTDFNENIGYFTTIDKVYTLGISPYSNQLIWTTNYTNTVHLIPRRHV